MKTEPNLSFKDITVTSGKARVTLTWLGEGYQGDYDPKDPKDAPLYRFDVYAHKSVKDARVESDTETWNAMVDASYCTHIDARNTKVAKLAAKYILSEVKETVESGQSIKKICETLSWTSTRDFSKK